MTPGNMPRLVMALKALSVVAGLVAALLWWKASGEVPLAPGAAIGGTLPDDPFNVALRQSAALNQWAALSTAASVFLMAIAEGLGLFRWGRS